MSTGREEEQEGERETKIRRSKNSGRGEMRTGPKPEEENDKRLQQPRRAKPERK